MTSYRNQWCFLDRKWLEQKLQQSLMASLKKVRMSSKKTRAETRRRSRSTLDAETLRRAEMLSSAAFARRANRLRHDESEEQQLSPKCEHKSGERSVKEEDGPEPKGTESSNRRRAGKMSDAATASKARMMAKTSQKYNTRSRAKAAANPVRHDKSEERQPCDMKDSNDTDRDAEGDCMKYVIMKGKTPFPCIIHDEPLEKDGIMNVTLLPFEVAMPLTDEFVQLYEEIHGPIPHVEDRGTPYLSKVLDSFREEYLKTGDGLWECPYCDSRSKYQSYFTDHLYCKNQSDPLSMKCPGRRTIVQLAIAAGSKIPALKNLITLKYIFC